MHLLKTLIACALTVPMHAAAAQQTAATINADPLAAFEWGEVSNGIQLRISTGVNTELITETESLLYLSLEMRNVSSAPVTLDFSQPTYDFEYEFDGTWYAFDPRALLRTKLDILFADRKLLQNLRAQQKTLAPGAREWTVLTMPLAGRSTALWLQPVAANGPRQRFEPKPGPHVVRVRPGRILEPGREAPASNAVTISFRTPTAVDTSLQTVSFVSSRDTALRELRFISGPADGQPLVRDALARPPQPVRAPRLLTAATLEIAEPIQYYELPLPRQLGAPDPLLPTLATRLYYPVKATGQDGGYVGLESSPSGSAFESIGGWRSNSTDRIFHALQEMQHLAGMRQLRGGNYEPRLVRVTSTPGASQPLVFWLHSSTGRPDLFYLPRDSDVGGWTKVERGTLYSTKDFMKAVRTLPVAPQHDRKWAVAAATVCAEKHADSNEVFSIFHPEQAVVEIELSEKQDHIVWYVVIPGPRPRGIIDAHLGREWLVDDTNGTCRAAGRARD